MSFTINDGASSPVAHVFTQEQAQQGRNVPAMFLDRSPALGPLSFLRLEALSRFATKQGGADQTQFHVYAGHFTDPGDGVVQKTGQFDGWLNINTTGTCSQEAVRKLYGMILVNAFANATIKDATFKIAPLVG